MRRTNQTTGRPRGPLVRRGVAPARCRRRRRGRRGLRPERPVAPAALAARAPPALGADVDDAARLSLALGRGACARSRGARTSREKVEDSASPPRRVIAVLCLCLSLSLSVSLSVSRLAQVLPQDKAARWPAEKVRLPPPVGAATVTSLSLRRPILTQHTISTFERSRCRRPSSGSCASSSGRPRRSRRATRSRCAMECNAMERNGTEMEWNGNGTETERKWNGNGMKWNKME